VIFGDERFLYRAYMPYLIDSDVLIDVSRGKPAARDYVDTLPEGWAISQVSALAKLA
jgi:predicted nucleic acid-binding protein